MNENAYQIVEPTPDASHAPKVGEAVRPKVVEARIRPLRRIHLEITPGVIKQAEWQAERGNMRLAVEICEQMLGDDRLYLALQKRVQGVLRCEVAFDPGAEGGDAPRYALKEGKEWDQMFPPDENSEIKMWGLLLGAGFGRLAWLPPDRRTGRRVPTIQSWPAEFARYTTEDGWMIGIDDAGTVVPLTPGDGEWILYTPFGTHRPWSRGLWRGLARWWLLKQYAMADWGAAGEVVAQRVVARPASDANPVIERADRRMLAEDINAMGAQGVIVLPDGFSMAVAEQSANTWQIYQAQIDMADTAFVVSSLWHNLGTQVDGGSFAAAATAVGVEQGALEYDAKADASFAYKQVLRQWAFVNWGSEDAAPTVRRVIEPPVDHQAEATTLAAAGPAIAQLVALGADRVKLLERFGVDVEVEPRQTADAIEVTQPLLDYGILTVNEVRAAYGLPSLGPAGDVRPTPAANLAPPPGAPQPGAFSLDAVPDAPDVDPVRVVRDSLAPDGEAIASPEAPAQGATTAASKTTLAQRREAWVSTQLRTDAIGDTGVKQASAAMAPLRQEVMTALSKCADYDEARALLTKIVGKASADQHAELIYRAMLLAHLEGAAGAS